MPSKRHPSEKLRIASWNVNGLRACVRKGFVQWLQSSEATIVGVQEVRANREQLPTPLSALSTWHFELVTADRAGYSGVALYSRVAPQGVQGSLGEPRFDREGRLQIAQFGRLTLANVYFPNGNGKARDNSRVPYKLDFYRCLERHLRPRLEAGEALVVMGDFNTAHREIDLARPKQNLKTSGFLPEERAELSRWLELGWVDSFRHFESGAGHYSWWSQRSGARDRNVGWRIDYILLSPGARPFLRGAGIASKVLGSDHCPIYADLDPRIL